MSRYLIRLDNGSKSKPEQIGEISSKFVKAAEKFGVLKNFRISEFAIELDIFAKDDESKTNAVNALVSEYGSLLSERNLNEEQPRIQSKREIVKLVIELFNEQRFWECHEVMEGIWRKEKISAEKDLQQGVILAASALVHAQKNEDSVCFGMLPRTMRKLSRWEKGDYYGLNVDLLRRRLENILETRRILFQKI